MGGRCAHHSPGGGLRARGVIRFVQESVDRAADTGTRRGGLARQTRRWSIAGAGTMLALCEALSRRGWALPPAAPS